MRRTIAVLACASCAAALPAAARLPAASMTVSLSTRRTSARPVVLAATLHYEMQCGYPGRDPVRLTVPAPPGRLARPAVRVNGRPAASVSTEGRVVTIGMPPRPRILCDAIGPGALKLRLAGLRNPAAAGTYRITARKGAQTFHVLVHLVHR